MRFSFVAGLLLQVTFLINGIGGESDTICDNGKYKIEEDIESVSGNCEDKLIVISEFLEPAGEETQCSKGVAQGQPQCMSHLLHYSESPPSSGDYRHIPPKYGQYSYVPPQRWLHSLVYGAVAFLYHPCAPVDQVVLLKEIASQCLRKHIITPYPHLLKEKPFALVAWGCVLRLSWVDTDLVKEWIKKHALKTPETFITQDGQYDHNLIEPAVILSTINDSIICPLDTQVTIEPPGFGDTTSKENSTTKNNSTTSIETPSISTNDQSIDHAPSENCTSDPASHCQNHTSVVVFVHQHPLLTSLFLVSLILFLIVMSLWIFCCRRSQTLRQKRQLGRYKPMGHFFSRKEKVIGIAIPEVGLPKAMPSEREKLLLESDEDEL